MKPSTQPMASAVTKALITSLDASQFAPPTHVV